MVTQGLDYVEKLNATIQTNATDTGNILRDVNATQRVLQNIQGNLTGVIPLAQGEVFLQPTQQEAQRHDNNNVLLPSQAQF